MLVGKLPRSFDMGNVLGFLGMLKDSYVWLQIIQRNRMSGVSGFSFNPFLLGMWIHFETGGYSHSQALKNQFCYKLTILPFFTYHLTNGNKTYLSKKIGD